MNLLFVCVRNAGRSQMAAALFERAAAGRHRARSAGSHPAATVQAEIVEAMREADIELSGRVPRKLEREDAERADPVVTMGCGDACPVIPGKRYLEWNLPDPAGKGVGAVRAIRDEINQRVTALLVELPDDDGAP